MAGVNVPQKKQGMLSAVAPIVGGIVGTAVGGPAGGAAGAKLGEMATSSGPGPSAVNSSAPNSAMQRKLNAPDPQAELFKAQQALKQLPEEDQRKYAPALDEATRRAKLTEGVA